MSADAWSRFTDKRYKHYAVVFPGFKYSLTHLVASLDLTQRPRLPQWLKPRDSVRARYDEAFADLPITLPARPEPNTVHARHLYTILIEDDARVTRDSFLDEMHRRRIGISVHYRALHAHPYYRDRYGFKPEDFPNAYYIASESSCCHLRPSSATAKSTA